MNVFTTLTVLSMAVAAAMTMIALGLVFRERRRSAARVAALEADIYRTEEEDILVLHDPLSPARSTERLLADSPTHRSFPIAPVAAAGAAVIVGMLVGVSRYRAATDEPVRPASAVAADQVLQLLALDYERGDDHLTVRGVVRNPPRGSEVDHLTAVVLLFNQQGGFLTSGRSVVESAALPPGTEARFAVTVPGAFDVGKYRVSFRTDDRVVPHVDRR